MRISDWSSDVCSSDLRVPADGTVETGQADFDESMLTGESRPVLRTEGERVAAGPVALGSSVRVRIDAVGDDTALDRKSVVEGRSVSARGDSGGGRYIKQHKTQLDM